MKQKFSKKQCDLLFQAVLVHDDIYFDATFPENFHLNYTQHQISQCYKICRQLWKQGVNRSHLHSIFDKIIHDQRLSDDEKLAYKHMRARFKHLRFAYLACDENHHCPASLYDLTRRMGKLQDSLKHKRPVSSTEKLKEFKKVRKLKLKTTVPFFTVVRWEINQFKPCSNESFKNYINSEMDFIKLHLVAKEVNGKDFHEMRKVISMQVALFDNLKTLFPSSYHEQVSQFLSTVNGMMGSLHDELIIKKFQKSSYYFDDTFQLPDDIRTRLVTIVDAYSKTIEKDSY